MKKRNSFLTVILLVMILFLSGCWDQKEINDRTYVIAIGLDKAENNRIKVTYLIANPEAGTLPQGGGGNEPPTMIVSFIADDYSASIETANTIVSKEITYDILDAIFVSEDFAKDDDFIRWTYDAAKNIEIRRDTYLVITKEPTLDYFQKTKPLIETRISMYFDSILKIGEENGMIPTNSKLLYYFRITEANADLFLATYSTTEHNDKKHFVNDDNFLAGQLHVDGNVNKTEFAGSAVFKHGKMIGKLTAEETRTATFLNNTLHISNLLTTFPDPFNEKFRVTTRISTKAKNKITINLQKGEIYVTVPIVVEVLTNHSMVDYYRNPEKREQLKKAIEENLTKKSEDLIKKTQEDFKGEPFGWSLIARKQFLTNKEYKVFNWMKMYPNMNVNVKFNIRFGNFGRQSEVPHLKEVRD